MSRKSLTVEPQPPACINQWPTDLQS